MSRSHTFLGVDAEGWEDATPENLPMSPFGGQVTVRHIIAGITTMLYRLDEEQRTTDQANRYRLALQLIAAQDYRGNRPASVTIAQDALDGS